MWDSTGHRKEGVCFV